MATPTPPTPDLPTQLAKAQADAASWRAQHDALQAKEQQWAQTNQDTAAARDTALKLRDQYQVLCAQAMLNTQTLQARVTFLEQLYASEHNGQAAPPTPPPPTT